MIYYDRSQECLYLIGDSVTEKVFHSIPQRVVLESLVVATNLWGIVADRNKVSNNIFIYGCKSDHLSGLVVRVLGYRSGDPGSIPGTTRKQKWWVWNRVHSALWVQLRSYLEENVAALV
jgi:hypothetical protein